MINAENDDKVYRIVSPERVNTDTGTSALPGIFTI